MSLIHVLACVGPSFIVARRPTARTAWAPNNTVIRQLRPAKLCLGLAARAFRVTRALSSARKASETRALEIFEGRAKPFCAALKPAKSKQSLNQVVLRCARSAYSLRSRSATTAHRAAAETAHRSPATRNMSSASDSEEDTRSPAQRIKDGQAEFAEETKAGDALLKKVTKGEARPLSDFFFCIISA